MDKACKECGVTKGWISYEECIGCNKERPANSDYYPTKYNKDGSVKREKP